MRSIGFYANCDEAIHSKIKDYMNKTYTEYVKYCEEISPSMRSMGFYNPHKTPHLYGVGIKAIKIKKNA